MTDTDRVQISLPAPHSVLEAGGESSTALLTAVERRLDEMAPGQVLEVSVCTLAAPIDAVVWCHVTGHSLLGLFVATTGTRLFIQKAAGEQRSRRLATGKEVTRGPA